MADDDELTLQEAADALGVHYMTAYRRVRLGKLPAHKSGGEWRVRRADLTPEAPVAPLAGSGDTGRRDYVSDLVRVMVAADEAAAWTVVQEALGSGMEPLDFSLEILAPALEAVGDGWEAGTITVAEEHQASAIASRLIGRLGPSLRRRGRSKGAVVLGAAPDDLHSIPTALMADALRAHGFEATDLGARVPPSSFATVAASADRLVAVGIAVTATDALDGAADTIEALRAAVDVPVVLGGSAIRNEAHARELGADAYGADAQSGIRIIESLVQTDKD